MLLRVLSFIQTSRIKGRGVGCFTLIKSGSTHFKELIELVVKAFTAFQYVCVILESRDIFIQTYKILEKFVHSMVTSQVFVPFFVSFNRFGEWHNVLTACATPVYNRQRSNPILATILIFTLIIIASGTSF